MQRFRLIATLPLIVTMLLERGADVNAKIYEGYTALQMASRNRHTEIVAMLLEKGSDVNAQDKDGYTALIWASVRGRTEIVAILKEWGAK